MLLRLGLALGASTLAGGLLFSRDLNPAVLERRYGRERSEFLTIDGLRIHVVDEGAGAPIVLLHGLADELSIFDAWVDRLRERYRCLRIDLPGHGLTGPDARERYGFAEMAELVAKVMTAKGIACAHLAGNSLGGAVAWQMAARRPERVDRLVLLAPVGYPIKGPFPQLPWQLALPWTGGAMMRFVPKRLFLRGVRDTFGDPQRFDRAAAQRQFDLFRRAGNRDALLAILSVDNGDPVPLLASIGAPTLLLWGAADPVTAASEAERFAADIPDAEICILDGCGHTPMAELVNRSVAELLAFIEPHDADARSGKQTPRHSVHREPEGREPEARAIDEADERP